MISFSVKYLQDLFQLLNVCRDTVLAVIILGPLFIAKDMQPRPLPRYTVKRNHFLYNLKLQFVFPFPLFEYIQEWRRSPLNVFSCTTASSAAVQAVGLEPCTAP